jgi:multidrug resistance efflux pump
MNAAAASVKAAEANVREARERLGPQGAENPQIRAAAASLERARRDLHDTTVVAPSRGIITDRRVAVGQFASAGQRLMTFIDIGAGWIVANVTERSLENVAPGNSAEIAIDLYPGRIFQGSVESWTWGVAPRAEPAAATSGLPSLRTQQSGWLRETQEFPVRIKFDSVPYPSGLRVGAQASVIIYTGSNQVMNALGWLWIRLVTLFAYVY